MSQPIFTLDAPKTVTPICPYFYQCGGCACQDVSYQDQLAAKEKWIRDLFAPLQPEQVRPIIGSGQEYPTFFRNKIRFNFIRHEGKVWPARHKKGETSADIPADHCYLQSEQANQVIQYIAAWADTYNWSLYDAHKSSGWLKHVLIRQGKQTGQIMVGLVTDMSPIPEQEVFVQDITAHLSFITSLYHTQSWGKNVSNLTDTLLWGAPTIEEKIGEYTFAISPQAFFQTNGDMVETLYTTIKNLAQSGSMVWDLYAGSATIGIFLSNAFQKVVSVESSQSNIQDAQANLTLNKVSNLELVPGLVEDVLTSAFIHSHETSDCIIIDPPRAGLHQRLRTLLPQLKAKRLIYVSCNPLTCLRDCQELCQNNMKVTLVQPIDMFPHSWHCEMIAVLEEK